MKAMSKEHKKEYAKMGAKTLKKHMKEEAKLVKEKEHKKACKK